MTATPETPVPLAPDSAAAAVLPISQMWASGSCDSSAVSGVVQDWYLFEEGVFGHYLRYEQFDGCNKSAQYPGAPWVTYNYIDARVKGFTRGRILKNIVFNDCSTVTCKLDWSPSAACSSVGFPTDASGWGKQGTFQMSTVATILKPATKDAAGNYLDQVGQGTAYFNMELNNSPGPYSCSSGFDTTPRVKQDMADMLYELADQIAAGGGPEFIPGLVDL